MMLCPRVFAAERARVAVFGDSCSDGLWWGFVESVPPKASYAFIRKGKVSSGLTQPSFFDWPAKAREMAADGWSAGIVLMGLNDNLPISVRGRWFNPGTPSWRRAYGDRVTAVTLAFTERGIPLFWLGTPCVRLKGMDGGMRAIHEVLADAVPSAGGVFLPLRGLTLDSEAAYTDTIEDGKGKTIRLRAADGMHFSESGNRFVARYVLNAMKADRATSAIFS